MHARTIHIHLICAFCQDCATQIRFWDAYKSACRKAGIKRGKFMNPEVAEFMVGDLLALS